MERFYNTNNTITVGRFTKEITDPIEEIMEGRSVHKPFGSRAELRSWIESNRPTYRRYFEGIVSHFGHKYKLI